MKKISLLLIMGLFILISQTVNAQFKLPGVLKKAKEEVKKSNKEKNEQEKAKEEKKTDIVPTYDGGGVYHDDKIGYDEFYVCTGKNSDDTTKIEKIEGYIHLRFCFAPSGRSPLEIIKNYEEAVSKKDGTVFPIINARKCIDAFMKKGHPYHYQTKYEYLQMPTMAYYYFSGKIPTDTVDYYVCVVAGNIDGKVVYSLATIETKPMDKGMISLENLDAGLVTKGHIAIYDIYFETGKSEIKGESYDALKMISEYLKAHSDKKYLVVGHTDNVGDFDANIKLSNERANAVVNRLIVNHSVNKGQLKSYGVGPATPVAINSTDEGKAKNRRVEIVEQ